MMSGHHRQRARPSLATLAIAVALIGGQPGESRAQGHDHAQHLASAGQPRAAQRATVRLYDKVLINQDGEPVRFIDDIVGDRIVVMDFVYTTCTTVCPVLSAIFGQVQQRLGPELGPELRMVSLSVDPSRDTPQRLKAYAATHRAGPEWVWLTGDKPEVDEVLRGLGAYTPDFEDHPSMVLVGDARTGEWKRFFGFTGPDTIVAAVDALQAAREAAAAR